MGLRACGAIIITHVMRAMRLIGHVDLGGLDACASHLLRPTSAPQGVMGYAWVFPFRRVVSICFLWAHVAGSTHRVMRVMGRAGYVRLWECGGVSVAIVGSSSGPRWRT